MTLDHLYVSTSGLTFRHARLIAVASALVLVAGCQPQPAADVAPASAPQASGDADSGDEIVAVVGSVPIRASQVQTEMIRRGADFLGGFDELSEKRMLLDQVIQREILAQAGEKAGYGEDPDVVAARKQMIGERFWRDQRAALRVDEAVTPEEIAARYEASKDSYSEPDRARASVIVLKFPANPTDEQRAAVREQAAALAASAEGDDPGGKTFAELAKEHSRDLGSRERGGDIGWLPKGATTYKWEAPVVEAMFSVPEVGGIAPPVETERGVILVKLTDKKVGTVKALSEVEAKIRSEIVAERHKQAQEARYEALRSSYAVSVRDDALARVGAATASAAVDELRPPAFPVGEVKR